MPSPLFFVSVDSKRLRFSVSYLESTLTKKEGAWGKTQKPEGIISRRQLRFFSLLCLALDESLGQHLLIAEPQIGDIG